MRSHRGHGPPFTYKAVRDRTAFQPPLALEGAVSPRDFQGSFGVDHVAIICKITTACTGWTQPRDTPIMIPMKWMIDKLTDQRWRHSMGRRFEAFTDEIFQVIRWVLVVGLADYLAQSHDAPILRLTYWVLAALLFGYIASRFLLRPEIAFLGNPQNFAARLLNSALNFFVCVVVFLLTLYAVATMTEAITSYRATL